MIDFLRKLFEGWFGSRTFGAARSPKWGEFKRDFAEINPKKCPICGNKRVQLHHKQSFATYPELELSKKNVVWLCEGMGTLQHHRGVGHLGNFQSINQSIDEDIEIWKKKFNTRPYWDGERWKKDR